jgi:hypothetical protein
MIYIHLNLVLFKLKLLLKSYKLPCSDKITAELIKAGGKTLHSGIHTLLKFIWNEKKLPQHWKASIIIVPKRLIKLTVVIREMSLFPTTYKMLSNILSRLTPYTDKITVYH